MELKPTLVFEVQCLQAGLALSLSIEKYHEIISTAQRSHVIQCHVALMPTLVSAVQVAVGRVYRKKQGP